MKPLPKYITVPVGYVILTGAGVLLFAGTTLAIIGKAFLGVGDDD